MKIPAVLIVIVSLSACQRAVKPAESAVQTTIYIVPRDTGIEARALFSARLLRWNASGLHWYETGVVRAALSPQALIEVKADPEVAMVLGDNNKAAEQPVQAPEPAPKPPACVTVAPQVAPTKITIPASVSTPVAISAPAPAPVQPIVQVQPPPTPQPASFQGLMAVPQVPQSPAIPQSAPMMMPGMMGGAPGISSMMPSMGLVDTLAGGFMNKVINRPPSCKITIPKKKASFRDAGGDGSIEVEASGSCAWQAQSSVEWIKILSGTGVSGSGIITYSVAPGQREKRAGSISIVMAAGGSPIRGKASQVINQGE